MTVKCNVLWLSGMVAICILKFTCSHVTQIRALPCLCCHWHLASVHCKLETYVEFKI